MRSASRTGPRIPILWAAIGLAGMLGCGHVPAPEPWPDPYRIATGTQAFRAPAEPPVDTVIVGGQLIREPSGSLTLQDALALALIRNPELAVFSWEVRAGEARALQAGQRPNPGLDIRLNRLAESSETTRFDDASTRLILSQVFELGAKRHRRLDLAQAERDLAGWDYEVKRIEVATLVASRFMAVLGAQRRVESLRDDVEFFEEARDMVLARVALGAMERVNAHRITRQVLLARIELQDAECELIAARHGLTATWGSRLSGFTQAVGDLERMGSIPDAEAALELGLQSPSLARSDAELIRRKAALALARAERVPNITAGVGIRVDHVGEEKDLLVDLEFTLPIFDREQGNILEARHNIAMARAQRRAAEAAVWDGIAEVYDDMAGGHIRALLLGNELIPLAREILEAARLGFEEEIMTLGDLLDARRDLTKAELQHIDALVDYQQARAMIEGILGRPLVEAE